MRIVALVIMMSLMTFAATPANAARIHHKYHMGTVSSFANNQVVIESGVYTLRPDVKVVRIEKESNGARYERKGRLSDVGVGKRVNLKAVGRTVSEIVVER